MDEKFDANLCMKFLRIGSLLNDWCQSKTQIYLYRLYGVLAVVWCAIYGCLTLGALVGGEPNLTQFTEIVSVLSAGILATLKGSIFIWLGEDLSELARRLRRPLPLLAVGLPGAEEQRRTVSEFNRRAAFVTRASLTVSASITVSWDLLPYLYSRFSGNLIFHRVTYHFTNISKFPGYDIEMLVNGGATMYCLFFNLLTDCYVFCVFMYVLLQMRLLNISITRVTDRARQIAGHGGSHADESDNKATRLTQDMLRTCAKQHIDVLEFTSHTQELFDKMLLIQFFIFTVIICLNIFQIAKNPSDVTTTSKFVSYVMSIIMDLYLYCNYGEEIRHELTTAQSEQLSMACYGCGWEDVTYSRFASSLRIMMLRASRPVVLSAGGFYNLTLETFVSIMQGSYSMCTLLLSTED